MQVQAIFKIASSSELPHIPESLSPEGTEFILLCLQRDSAARPSALDLLQHPFVADVELNGNDKLMEYLNFTSRCVLFLQFNWCSGFMSEESYFIQMMTAVLLRRKAYLI